MTRRVRAECSFEGCGRPVRGQGLCQGHHWQKANKGTLTPLRHRRLKDSLDIPCSITICARPATSTGFLCREHTSIARQYTIPAEHYRSMYELGCQICQTSGPLSVDHDHTCCAAPKTSCGRCVRGLLCTGCNFLLAWADRSGLPTQQLLSNVAWYYEEYSLWGAHSDWAQKQMEEIDA